jgi:hypothetical protein
MLATCTDVCPRSRHTVASRVMPYFPVTALIAWRARSGDGT